MTRTLLERGFTPAQIARGEVGLDESVLLNRDPDRLVEAVQDAVARSRDQSAAGRSQDAGYLKGDEDWD